jgi:hypothetical protein
MTGIFQSSKIIPEKFQEFGRINVFHQVYIMLQIDDRSSQTMNNCRMIKFSHKNLGHKLLSLLSLSRKGSFLFGNLLVISMLVALGGVEV